MDEYNAKIELHRLNDFLDEPVLLIGGLAVQRYIIGRSSKDLDLVCTLDQQKRLLAFAYPPEEYEVDEKQNDLRPDIVCTNLRNGVKIFLGTKILERPPYPYIDYELFFEGAIPFEYDGKVADKIFVPAAHVLAYSKLLSFISRRVGPKGLKDLDDFSSLTNTKQFSLNHFIAFIERAKALEHIQSFFSKAELSEDEKNVLRKSSPIRFQNAFPLSLTETGKQEISAEGSSAGLIRKIGELANSPMSTVLGRFFDAVSDLQFSTDVIRRNWDISVKYDISRVSKGFIEEVIEWEYELSNVRSYPVKYPVTLTHSADNQAGRISKVFTVLPDGKRTEVNFDEELSFDGQHFKKQMAEIDLQPGTPYYVTLYYKQTWPVNPSQPFILNATTSKEPCLNCRIRFQVPEGMRISLLNRDIIEPHVVDGVYDVRLPRPLLAEQKIEYVLEPDHD